MYSIQFCSLNKLKTDRGNIRIPQESDWDYMFEKGNPFKYIFNNIDDANKKRIDLYKSNEGYYSNGYFRIVYVGGIVINKEVNDNDKLTIYVGLQKNSSGRYYHLDELIPSLISSNYNHIMFKQVGPTIQYQNEINEIIRRVQFYTDKIVEFIN